MREFLQKLELPYVHHAFQGKVCQAPAGDVFSHFRVEKSLSTEDVPGSLLVSPPRNISSFLNRPLVSFQAVLKVVWYVHPSSALRKGSSSR
ncbi:hypothetical protein PsorP6_011251 [Peronosclerospora sorghi]|uniref:Uncharacterized protein n=1 Tax=Peronosclerospora sorghi TaxID=230839 RepID=A0ACC0WLC4_9STRA|nr:hypothetical protein PsorP6_011251 [Peronosclerospora sorghi]